MKLKFYFPLLLVLIFATSCSKYGYVRLKYPTAPDATLPENIKTIAILNRSLPPKDKDGKSNAVAEAIITGEVAGSDKVASDQTVKAVFDRFNAYRDYSIVYPSTSRLTGSGSRAIPDPLDWRKVQAVCDSTKADVLLVLEMFDSNSDLLASTITNGVVNVLAGNTNVPPPPAQIRMNVVCYWRMYDPKTQKIIDQFQTNKVLTFNSNGLINIPPPEALPETAYAAGKEYVNRFMPGYYFVKRDLYKRGKGKYKQQFKTGFRKSEVANWEGAIAVWTEIAKSASGRNAGKACLNIAVGNEVLGKSEEALIWAKKAYEDYGNKIARDYANTLKDRLNYE